MGHHEGVTTTGRRDGAMTDGRTRTDDERREEEPREGENGWTEPPPRTYEFGDAPRRKSIDCRDIPPPPPLWLLLSLCDAITPT